MVYVGATWVCPLAVVVAYGVLQFMCSSALMTMLKLSLCARLMCCAVLCCAGTVIPPGKPLHLTPSVSAFRSRTSSPKAGEAVFVLQAPDALIPAGGGIVSWSVTDENGSSVNFS